MIDIRVLIVEDEKKLTKALGYLASKEGIQLDVANDGETGWLLASKGIYDVIVLDIMLPLLDGLEILKNIRAAKQSTPVLLLTALDTIEDRVKGLDLGADDYLVKPFATQELFARVRSLYRRVDKSYSQDTISMGNIVYNSSTKQLTVDNESRELTCKEGELMEMFLRSPNRVFSRDYILDRIWGYDKDVTENNIEIYIHYLRKKLSGSTGIALKTVRGIGYTLKEK